MPTPTPNPTISDVVPPGGTSATATPTLVVPTSPNQSMMDLLGWPLLIIGIVVILALAVLILALLRVRDRNLRVISAPAAAQLDLGATGGSLIPWGEIDRLVRAYDLAPTRTEQALLTDQLAAHGVQMILVTPGSPLDPHWHNVAISTSRSSPGPPQVLDVVRPGWYLPPTTTIRPADVRVAI
jgi:hypothetical protein